ncbi:hypothetical protein VNI00_012018 [Paramarasmius palmivorus]|uniref:HMG box domain-containing protein n=1 Tax=Paramarasmius palmivorus TaxID=297713 RepID=A0AAW0C898_9AGAR
MANSKEKIPRPPNAWILYRSDKAGELSTQLNANGQRKTQAQISKEIAEMWKVVTPEEKMEYERRAEAEKHRHSELYPGYRFQPVKKEEKQKLKEQKRISDREARMRTRGHPYARLDRTVSPSDHPTPSTSDLQPSSSAQPYPVDHIHQNFGPSPPVYAADSPGPIHTPESLPLILEPHAPALSLDATHIQDHAETNNDGGIDYASFDDPNIWQPPSFSQGETAMGTTAYWPDSNQQSQDFVSMNLPQPSYVQVPGFDDTLATMTRTDNPSIFQLSNVDYSLLDSNAELDVSLGSFNFDPNSFASAGWNDFLQSITNGDLGSLDQAQPEAGSSQPTHGEQMYTQPPYHDPYSTSRNSSGSVPSHHSSDVDAYNDMSAFINYDGAASSASTPLPPAETSRSTSSSSVVYVPDQSSSHQATFVPPVHNGQRRVGGNWRPSLQREPIPRWKVSAS